MKTSSVVGPRLDLYRSLRIARDRAPRGASFACLEKRLEAELALRPARVDLVATVRVAQGLGGDLSWAFEVLDEPVAAGDDRLRGHTLVQRALLRLSTGLT